jgi:hypothetical protein
MVHALEITRGLLKKDGLLIDIHPSGEPPLIEAHVGGEVRIAGHLEETDDFVEYFEADEALLDVAGRGLFKLERKGLFAFKVHAVTIGALAKYLDTEWSDAVLREEIVERASELMGDPGEDRKIVLREIVRIARFRASGK